MDKNSIKKYAVWARRELIEKVSQKALRFGIDGVSKIDNKADNVNGHLLTEEEKRQRQALIHRIEDKSYAGVMEEVAYTWFNRFIALRFMEVNGYLPSHVRVFTDEAGNFNPQIMTEALHLNIDGIDLEKVYELKNNNKDEDLFKYLLITQCNALADILPRMFSKINDYTELLLPDFLLREGSVVEQLVNQKTGIPEADWQDQVQIIGWLYQYYNVEPKDKAFNDLKKNVKVSKDKIPAVTQLFTPDWIVHYMVENSLGRLWLEDSGNRKLNGEWDYYVDDVSQDYTTTIEVPEVVLKATKVKPEEIKCIDPCMGSGHILCVLFDMLISIYEEYGYSAREAAASIVENNIWGLDIDERAAQLAYFAIMMKARQYDRRFFNKGIQPHVYAIEESNGLEFDGDFSELGFSDCEKNIITYLYDMFTDAKEYGSLLQPEEKGYDELLNKWKKISNQAFDDLHKMAWYMYAGQRFETLICQAQALSQKYDIVVTNPPYMVLNNGSPKLVNYVKKHYDDGKADLFAAFISRCNSMTRINGYQAMITQHSWMYLSSFEKLRKTILEKDIKSLIHLGAHAFEEIGGEVVQTVAFVLKNTFNNGHKSRVIRLVEYGSEKEKEMAFIAKKDVFDVNMKSFFAIEGSPIAYRATPDMLSVFDKAQGLAFIANPRQGLISGDVNRFVRKWYECSSERISFSNDRSKKWFPYNNGGECRRWYGNNEDVVNWENDGEEIQNFKDDKGKQRSRPQNQQFYFQEGGTWTAISSGKFSVRYFPEGFLFSNAGMAIFCEHKELLYLIGFLNSKLSQTYLHLFNEGLNYNQGDIAKLPIVVDETKEDEIISIVNECIRLEKEDWDSYEISWDFKIHPMICTGSSSIKEAYEEWEKAKTKHVDDLIHFEEKLNEEFIEIYGLSKDLDAQITKEDITIKSITPQIAVKSLISYAVGCMFGRYSLDKEGLVFAGGKWNSDNYKTFIPDEDGIIPICDDEYFKDDIVGRFIDFIEVVFGKEQLNENLQYIADALGSGISARETIRKYFISEFYTDHLKMYQKRPIYWMFDSGKKNGFKCLVYLHRYKADTIARIRTDYVHEQQARYRTAIDEIEQRIGSVSGSDLVKLNKKNNTLKAQAEELHGYEEKIHHIADQMIEIDLDDGVKKNYAIFKDVLAKI